MLKFTSPRWTHNFYPLFVGQGLSTLLSTTVNYALIFYLTAITHSASVLSLAQIISLIPLALLSPFAGILIDRFSKKKILMLSDALVGTITLFLFLKGLASGGQLTISLILFSNFLRSVALSVQNPTTQSSVPELVPSEHLLKVNGHYSALQAVNQLFPPVLGGLLYGLLPINDLLLFSVLANLVGLATVGITRFPSFATSINSSFHLIQELKSGFVELKRNRPLFHLLMYKVVSVALIMPTTVLYPLMTTEHFHGSLKVSAPIVEVSLAVGMLLSGLSLAHLPHLVHRLFFTATGTITVAASLLISGFLPANRLGFSCFVLVNFCAGFALPLIDAPIQTLLQETISVEHRGKVISLFLMFIGLSGPLGLIIGSFLSIILPTVGMFVTSGACLLLLFFLGLRDKQLRSLQ
ncbi:MFS transporter, DHA3 family, macrolide efflux protein [Enterococcus sp. AZ194]|uniref:MFS transporter n=1 Tax=Enterococcus sp. AZ194 TaxID=2774629 RepID=UPI003F28604F